MFILRESFSLLMILTAFGIGLAFTICVVTVSGALAFRLAEWVAGG